VDPVVVLFVRSDSIYKTLPGLDCYDKDRDARTWPGGCPAVCHPPCRAWGRFAAWCHADEAEKALAPWAVEQVRHWGGVIEHPSASRLWAACDLPRPGAGSDAAGGFSLAVEQHWWGHRATKPTWLYVCGCEPGDVPAMPLTLTEATHVVARDRRGNGRNRTKPHCTHAEREATPPAFAVWLVELARKCSKHNAPAEHSAASADMLRRDVGEDLT